MTLLFERAEFEARQSRVSGAMAAQGLDGMLLFKQESMFYLTGYDTDGFVLFQTLFFGADGRLCLLTRSADRYQAQYTSTIDDVRVWVDAGDQNPALGVKDMLESLSMDGKRIGVEYDAYGLSARRGKAVDEALAGFCPLSDASALIREIRLVKTPAELACFRTAGSLCDKARDVAIQLSVPGASEGDIRAAMHREIWSGDGDTPAHVWPMGAGDKAPLIRYHCGASRIETNDQMFHEFAAPYRHYHAAMTLTVLTGRVQERQQEMYTVCRDALEAVEEVLRSGNTVGDLFEAHRRVYVDAGHGDHYLNVCGYSMGAVFPSTWMEDPLIRRGDPLVLEPGMVFFMHMLMVDRERRLMMSLGEQALVTENACEPITHAPRELPVNS